MPLIKGMKSTTIWKAFFLNALASTMIIFITVTVKEKFDTFKNKRMKKLSVQRAVLNFLLDFV